MDQFTRADLSRLAEANLDPAVSVFMPTYRTGREVSQNLIRFKNLVKTVGQELRRYGADEALRESLSELRARERDELWWQRQSDGLAVFLAADRCELYRLPLALEEQVVVGPRFQVKPLVPLLQGDGRFYVLAASQNSVRLLAGTRYHVDELEVAGLPADLRSALNIDEYLSSMQHHVAGMANGAPGSTLFHGQGGSGMEVRKKDEIQQFFHRLDRALATFLTDENVPLVFAGVEYLFPLFRRTCQFSGLVDEPVPGNPDSLSAAQLHERAWSVVAPLFHKRSDAALRRYEKLAGGREVTARMPEILGASQHGQIDTLLIAEGADVRGVFDAETGAVRRDNGHPASDLLNQAAVQSLTAGGTVLTLPREQMPAAAPAAAILRYPLPAHEATELSPVGATG